MSLEGHFDTMINVLEELLHELRGIKGEIEYLNKMVEGEFEKMVESLNRIEEKIEEI